MQVAFKDNTPARDVPQLFYQLRKKISDIKDDLPAGLIGPSVNDEYGDVNSILYMLTSDGADYAQMKKVAEAFRQRLLKVKNVTKVNLYGTQDERSSSNSPTPSSRRSASRPTNYSNRSPVRTRWCRPASWRPPRSACRCA